MTFYVFVISALIYATYGLQFFKGMDNGFVYDPDEHDDGALEFCTNLKDCFWLITYQALPEGDIGRVMHEVGPQHEKFAGRMVYSLSFFVWIGLLLYNIVTGVTFA